MHYRVIHQLRERNFDKPVTRSEIEVLDYLEKNFAKIPHTSVLKVAAESFTSQATVNRTCKILGFRGFSELKYAVEEDLVLMKSSSEKHIAHTEYILRKIAFDSVDEVAKVVSENRRKLLLFGLGASSISALYLQRQLLYKGIPSTLIAEVQMLRNFEDFTIIILSSSGETQRCHQMAKEAQKRGLKVLALTKKDSTLMQFSDLTFYHEVPVDKQKGISREQQLHIILMVNELIDRI